MFGDVLAILVAMCADVERVVPQENPHAITLPPVDTTDQT